MNRLNILKKYTSKISVNNEHLRVKEMRESNMTKTTENQIAKSGILLKDIILHFREKCKTCGHHRIMHNENGKCEGVMNKPCMSGCDSFEAEDL